MSLFSGLSSLAGSFSGMFNSIADIGISSRLGDSLMSGGEHSENHFGESMSSSTMSSHSSDFGSSGFDSHF
jgi:hypothetical protein